MLPTPRRIVPQRVSGAQDVSRHRGRFRGWLLRVAVNACYDQLRRRQRRPSDSLDALGDAPDELGPAERMPDPSAGPEQQALSGEVARQIQDALDQFAARTAPDRRLCDIQGLSYDEAAQAMSVELGTVKSRLSRARANLRDAAACERGTIRALRSV